MSSITCFKAYDLRGRIPNELNDDVAYRVARGYAQFLLAAIAHRISARGEIPFLHVFSENAGAIALYRRQGMEIRRRLHVTVLGRVS